MHFCSADITPNMAYKLLVSTVLPRPIAFVTTLNASGQVNAAPFSFFNAMGSEPPVVVLGFEPKIDGQQKDTPNNILSTEEFVVNIVDEALAAQMNQCSAPVGAEVDETQLAKLDVIPSVGVAPPRIKASPVNFECRLMQHVPLAGGGRIVIGEVLHFHLRDDLVTSTEPLRIDINQLAPISRLSGPLYGRVTDQFEIKRPK